MKTLFLLPTLLAALNLLPAGRVTAQTFTTLYTFSASSINSSSGFYTNSDGWNPRAGLILSGNTLYGTAYYGGSSGGGTVFAVNTDGTGFTNLHSFSILYYNNDGVFPQAGLILSGNTLYGTASVGGRSADNGTVFAVNTDSTGFTNLHRFTQGTPYCFYIDYSGPVPAIIDGCYHNSDGANPNAGLLLTNNTLYGTASLGGSSGNGTVFAVKTDGTGFTNLHTFAGGSDGANPVASLILSGNTLYGTAQSGSFGTVFALNTDGTGFTNLHTFTGGSDGAYPHAGLILSSNTLYGTAEFGNFGTVFAVNTDGTGFTTLHGPQGMRCDSDLDCPDGSECIAGYCVQISDIAGIAGSFAGLILSGNTLYGTAAYGGSSGNGMVFALHTDGTGFTNLHSFTAVSTGYFGTNSDGATPQAGLVLSGNTLYGTAAHGGSSGNGTVFSISLPSPPVARCKHVTMAAGANCSADASIDDGSFSPNAGDTITLVQSPSGPYPLGDTSVTLTVTDGHGASNSCVATVHVEGAAEQITDIIALAQNLGLQPGTANSLIEKLQGAASALDRGNLQAAFGSLGAFLNEANAQKGKKLSVAQTDLLNAEATRIRAVVGCN